MRQRGRSLKRFAMFECEICGSQKETEYQNGKRDKSCGCRHRIRKHGETSGKRSKLFRIWDGMIYRCSKSSFKNYAGKGIIVCEDWKVFGNFRDWALSNGYKEGLTIDRKNNDIGYCPKNCQFAMLKYNSVKNSKNKLGYNISEEIRLKNSEGISIKNLAMKYDVTKAHIYRIINRKHWDKPYYKDENKNEFI